MHKTYFVNRELTQRRQQTTTRTAKKQNWLRLVKQFCTYITLCVHFFASLHDYGMKIPTCNFMFCGERDVNTRQWLSFSLPELQHSLLEFNPRKKCPRLSSWTRWNKRDRVWSRANSLFKWSFRSCHHRRCLSSVMLVNVGWRIKWRAGRGGFLANPVIYNRILISRALGFSNSLIIWTRHNFPSPVKHYFQTSW